MSGTASEFGSDRARPRRGFGQGVSGGAIDDHLALVCDPKTGEDEHLTQLVSSAAEQGRLVAVSGGRHRMGNERDDAVRSLVTCLPTAEGGVQTVALAQRRSDIRDTDHGQQRRDRRAGQPLRCVAENVGDAAYEGVVPREDRVGPQREIRAEAKNGHHSRWAAAGGRRASSAGLKTASMSGSRRRGRVTARRRPAIGFASVSRRTTDIRVAPRNCTGAVRCRCCEPRRSIVTLRNRTCYKD